MVWPEIWIRLSWKKEQWTSIHNYANFTSESPLIFWNNKVIQTFVSHYSLRITSYSCGLLDPFHFLQNFWFLKNLGSIPLVETNLVRFFFLIPLAWAFCVLLCWQAFFCCYFRSNEERDNECMVRWHFMWWRKREIQMTAADKNLYKERAWCILVQ